MVESLTQESFYYLFREGKEVYERLITTVSFNYEYYGNMYYKPFQNMTRYPFFNYLISRSLYSLKGVFTKTVVSHNSLLPCVLYNIINKIQGVSELCAQTSEYCS